MQVLYALVAMMVLGIFSLNMNRGIQSNQSRMFLNEVSTQMTAIASEFLEEIGNLPYDAATISGQLEPNATNFQNPIAGAPDCNVNYDEIGRFFHGCLAMNDLHGKAGTRTVDRFSYDAGGSTHVVNGFTYDVSVTLEYLQMASDAVSATPTFRKRATVTITNAQLVVGNNGQPLEIEVSRIFNYPRVIG